MNKSKEAGKGDKDRTTDFKRRDKNHDQINWPSRGKKVRDETMHVGKQY